MERSFSQVREHVDRAMFALLTRRNLSPVALGDECHYNSDFPPCPAASSKAMRGWRQCAAFTTVDCSVGLIVAKHSI